MPRFGQLRAFHESQVEFHCKMAREHARHGHDGAELRHQQAAEAHKAASAALFDSKTAGAAMRASAKADEASQMVGVRPLMPWPGSLKASKLKFFK